MSAHRCSTGARTLCRAIVWAASALALVSAARATEQFFDRVEQALTTSAFDGQIRARFSGIADLEAYSFQQPPPGLLESTQHELLSPRLTLFLDAQLGRQAYVFAQVRADRGFDPGSRATEIRLDEYALRVTPWRGRPIHLQVGRFATVVGNWTARHASWVNPFVTAPLVYENLTGIWDTEEIRSTGTLLQWSHVRPGLPRSVTAIEKSLRVPIIWGPSYATGLAVAGDIGSLRYAFEVKHAPLSSRPQTWRSTRGHSDIPTLSGRVSYRPNPMWDVGVSASSGSYLRPSAEASLPSGRRLKDYRQILVAHDLSFAWHHFQLWAEIFASRFEIPGVGDADTVAYYAEAKYKVSPQTFGALRWNHQLYDSLADRNGRVKWGKDASRLDVGIGHRLSAHVQMKVQYNLQHGDTEPHSQGHLAAAQLTVRF